MTHAYGEAKHNTCPHYLGTGEITGDGGRQTIGVLRRATKASSRAARGSWCIDMIGSSFAVTDCQSLIYTPLSLRVFSGLD